MRLGKWEKDFVEMDLAFSAISPFRFSHSKGEIMAFVLGRFPAAFFCRSVGLLFAKLAPFVGGCGCFLIGFSYGEMFSHFLKNKEK